MNENIIYEYNEYGDRVKVITFPNGTVIKYIDNPVPDEAVE